MPEMKKNPSESQFALCIENRDCDDLEKRKIYQILPDEEAAQEGYLRVIDESWEDYLYPATVVWRPSLLDDVSVISSVTTPPPTY